jgi:hypothetical protein
MYTIREINAPDKQRGAVGRITIVQKPSTILFAALHHTMYDVFDMDEVFSNLVNISRSLASVHRAYAEDERRRRSFTFTFEYFTIASAERTQMSWQMPSEQHESNDHGTVISRCNSVVALWLGGAPIKKIKNPVFRKRMAVLRKKLEHKIQLLRRQLHANDQMRDVIRGMREELYAGMSILESRITFENADIAIQQGHNVKILTLVSTFFLPLTFVTSIFGMTNMLTEQNYTAFAVVIATVCVPFFVLIGLFNTTGGPRIWLDKAVLVSTSVIHGLWWLISCGRPRNDPPISPAEWDTGRWPPTQNGGWDLEPDGQVTMPLPKAKRSLFWRREINLAWLRCGIWRVCVMLRVDDKMCSEGMSGMNTDSLPM